MKLLSVKALWMPLRISSSLDLRADGTFSFRREAFRYEKLAPAAQFTWTHTTASLQPRHPAVAPNHRCFEQSPDGGWRACASVPAAAQTELIRELRALLARPEALASLVADLHMRALVDAGISTGSIRVSISLDYAIDAVRARRAGGQMRVAALDASGAVLVASRWEYGNATKPLMDLPYGSSRAITKLAGLWRSCDALVTRRQGAALRALLYPTTGRRL
jgi:hypothetical protein